MAQAILNQILNQLEMLELEELEQLNQAIYQQLTKQKETNDRAAVHEALLASGLVKRIRKPSGQPVERQLLEIEGEPVSETIIRERDLIQPGQDYPIWSPYDADEAASIMLEVITQARKEALE